MRCSTPTRFFNHYNNTPKSIYRFFVYGYSVGGPVYIPKHLEHAEEEAVLLLLAGVHQAEAGHGDPALRWFRRRTSGPTASAISGHGRGTGCRATSSTAAWSDSSPCVPAYTNSNGTNEDSTLVNPAANKAVLDRRQLSSLIGTQYYDSTSAAYGQAMLNFLPPPNMCTAASGIYNGAAISASNCPAGMTTTGITRPTTTASTTTTSSRRRTRGATTRLRFDSNLTSKLTAWARYINDFDLQNDCSNCIQQYDPTAKAWVNSYYEHPNPGHGYGVGITYTISPTMVNEFTFGKSYNTWSYYPNDPDALARAQMGNPPSFDNFATDPNFVNDTGGVRPAGLGTGPLNFMDIVPGLSFGGGQITESGGTFCGGGGIGDCPYTNWNNIYSFNDEISKVQGRHNLKAGIFIEHTEKVQHSGQGNYTGNYNFSSGGAAMAADTQDGYANGWLGNFNTYNEGPRDIGDWWYWEIESFVQDNWRVSRRLTLDLGLRFYHTGSIANVNTGVNGEAAFVRSAYSAASAERIYYPGCAISTASRLVPRGGPVRHRSDHGLQDVLQLPGNPGAGFGGRLYRHADARSGHGDRRHQRPSAGSLHPADAVSGAAHRLRLGCVRQRQDGRTRRRGNLHQPRRFQHDQRRDRAGSGHRRGLGVLLERQQHQREPRGPAGQCGGWRANAGVGLRGQPAQRIGLQRQPQIQQNVGFSTVVEASWVFNLRRHIPSNWAINYHAALRAVQPRPGPAPWRSTCSTRRRTAV